MLKKAVREEHGIDLILEPQPDHQLRVHTPDTVRNSLPPICVDRIIASSFAKTEAEAIVSSADDQLFETRFPIASDKFPGMRVLDRRGDKSMDISVRIRTPRTDKPDCITYMTVLAFQEEVALSL